MVNLPTQLARLLEQFEAHGILLVEWEIDLMARLGYPLVSCRDLFFLVPDDQIVTADKLAVELGFQPADLETLRPAYTSEYSGRGLRYVTYDPGEIQYVDNTKRRLVLLPMSWTGISTDEVRRLSAAENNLPCTVYTAPITTACTAFMRILSREERGSSLRSHMIGELCCVIACRYFDMSYEGDYLEIPPDDQPWSEKEVLEMENAVKELEGWTMKAGEEWIQHELIRAMTGKISYDDLPCRMEW